MPSDPAEQVAELAKWQEPLSLALVSRRWPRPQGLCPCEKSRWWCPCFVWGTCENKPMQRQRGELIPIWEVVSGLDGPVKETREASPQARHHFTRVDQVNQLPRRITTSARINFEHRKGTAWEPRSRTG